MPAKRIETDDERIVEMMSRGWSAEMIADALSSSGQRVSQRTITRRMSALRGKAKAARASRRAAPAPVATEAVAPSGLALEEYDQLIAHYEQLSRTALDAGDESAAQGWARVALQHRVERRKAEPPTKNDPNDNPDMIKLAATVADRLHKMIDEVSRG